MVVMQRQFTRFELFQANVLGPVGSAPEPERFRGVVRTLVEVPMWHCYRLPHGRSETLI